MKVAESSNTPIEILVELSKDKNYMVRREVAANPNTPIEILIELSKSGYYEVRQYVPKNPNTPQDVLITLSKDKDDDVRRNVAANPNTPIETLIELSKDKHYWVRREVATNPNTPIETLQELSKDEYNVVRRLIAENPNTPIKIIENLFINDMLPKDTKDIILNKLLNREDVNINLVNKYLKLDIKNEAKILFMLSMEKFPNEYKKNFIKEYMIKENISYMKYDSELYGGFEILTNNDNNCKVLLNDSEILTFDKLKVKNPIITTKEEAIELIKTSTYNEEYCSQTDYNDENNTLVLDIQKNASNPYKDLPEEFKNDLDVIIATLKKDSGDWTDHYSNENPYRDERATLTSYTEYKSLNIYELLPDSIKNSQEFKDKIFYEFVLPRCGTNNYFRSIIEKLYENKDSSIEIKTEICDTLTKKYNDSLPTYEDQLADIISTNYENASIYDDGYRMSESDIIDYGYHDLKATFEKQYSHSIYFDDSLKNIIKEVEDYKELSNKMKNIEEKLSNNSEALINFFKEKNIDPKSEEAKKMKQTFNETQDNLINELSEVKEKMNEYTKEKEVLEKTFNDR